MTGVNVFLYSRATGAITLVSHNASSNTLEGNDSSYRPSISTDGAYVAFESLATSLVGGTDPVRGLDVFLYTRAGGAITLVSHIPGSATTTGNLPSTIPTISANGAFVAFVSEATNLVPNQSDSNGALDVYLFERGSGVVTLASHVPASSSATANGVVEAAAARISADGGFVVFSSSATNLVLSQTDLNGYPDVFVFSRTTGAVTLVSRAAASATETANSASTDPSISADGAFIAFSSEATNLIANQADVNAGSGSEDTFLSSRATGAVTLMSHPPASSVTTANSRSTRPSISADGAVVAFFSTATNLVTGQNDSAENNWDMFLFTRATGEVTLVSHTAAGVTTAAGQLLVGPPVISSISANGAVVAFVSPATNIVAGQSDANGAEDVFVSSAAGGGGSNDAVADFNGDGKTDISVFRPSDNTWFVRSGVTMGFGASGDVPVPCDYDGNGTTDIAVFRPGVGGWLINGQPSQFLGANGDVPVPGDYDGDGDCDVAVYRPSVGGWYRVSQATVFLGLSTDIPVSADYDGNGTTDMAVYRPSVGGWYRTGGAATVFHGFSTDIPVPANYDGSGGADIAVFRPSVGGWYVNGQGTQFLGLSGDIPVPGDYAGDGTADRAVFRPPTGAWYVGAQAPVFFGLDGDRPLPLPSAIRRVFFP